MTNTELIAKIKTEIERRRDSYLKAHGKYGRDADYIAATEDLRLLEFLDTIESEYPVPNDAEEAAKEYARYHYTNTFSKELAKNDFLAGSAWKEIQMMKEAINGWLDEDNEPPYDLNVVCEEKIPFGKFKHGDKVCIIICKGE